MRLAAALVFLLALSAVPVMAISDEEYNDVTSRALATINAGKVEEGLDLVRGRVKAEPNEGAWRATLATYCMQVGRFDEARNQFAEAAKLFNKAGKPGHEAQAYCFLGELEEGGFNDMEAAFKNYKKALEIAPQHEQAKAGAARYGQWRLVQAMKKDVPAAEKERSPSKPSDGSQPSKTAYTHTFHLRNGQVFDALLVSTDPAGVWVEIDAGTRMYFKNSEVDRSVPIKGIEAASAKAEALAAAAPIALDDVKAWRSGATLSTCTVDGLAGTWERTKVLRFTDPAAWPPMFRQAPPVEFWKFHADGHVQNVMATAGMEEMSLKSMHALKPVNTFKLNGETIEAVFPELQTTLVMGCGLVERSTVEGVHPGDLVFTQAWAKPDAAELVRVFRKK